MAEVLAIVQQFLDRKVPLQSSHQVLSCDSMPGFVKENRDAICSAGLSVQHKAIRNHGFWNGIVRAAGVTAQPFGISDSSEEDDRVAAEDTKDS